MHLALQEEHLGPRSRLLDSPLNPPCTFTSETLCCGHHGPSLGRTVAGKVKEVGPIGVYPVNSCERTWRVVPRQRVKVNQTFGLRAENVVEPSRLKCSTGSCLESSRRRAKVDHFRGLKGRPARHRPLEQKHTTSERDLDRPCGNEPIPGRSHQRVVKVVPGPVGVLGRQCHKLRHLRVLACVRPGSESGYPPSESFGREFSLACRASAPVTRKLIQCCSPARTCTRHDQR